MSTLFKIKPLIILSILIISIILQISCIDNNYVILHYHAAIEFTPTERSLLVQSCKEWSDWTNDRLYCEIQFDINNNQINWRDDKNVIGFLNHNDPIAKNLPGYNSGFVAMTLLSHKIVFFSDIMSKDLFLQISMHEMGHAFGFAHSAGTNGIMSGKGYTPIWWDEFDRQECVQLGWCE